MPQHTANLSVMYRAELQLKAALLGGKVRLNPRDLPLHGRYMTVTRPERFPVSRLNVF